jgi:hypothetical protein
MKGGSGAGEPCDHLFTGQVESVPPMETCKGRPRIVKPSLCLSREGPGSWGKSKSCLEILRGAFEHPGIPPLPAKDLKRSAANEESVEVPRIQTNGVVEIIQGTFIVAAPVL